ncbi:type IV secretion system protein VirB2 [Rhizobium sp. PP-F2F-G36]|nr:type IV secretion system protein VirB2 [Rhizobium sp. PP-F2F-G36]
MFTGTRPAPVLKVALTAVILAAALTEPAHAQGIENTLQNIVTLLTGNVARLLAIIATVVVGIAWMFGYLDLRKAAFVVLGIGIIFGATEIVNTIAGG